MTRLRGFAPVAGDNATRLILGSMPGMASLRAGQYYAHPRNQFWRLLGELLSLDPGMPYARRVQALADSGIGLWDVLKSCTRAGSLDAAIVKDSLIPNDFAVFFARHRQIRRVYFNGAAAEQCYRRRVLPLLPAGSPVCRRLPSTSPAHAALSFADKLAAWRVIMEDAGRPHGLRKNSGS